MSNIYQLLLRKSDVLKSSQFKKFISRSTFWELQPKQISLSFQTSCYNLKIRSLGPNLCEHFPVDTLHRFNVYKTSLRRRRRRIDVLQTLKRHLVSTGKREHQICKTNSVSFAYRAEITRSPLYGNKKGRKTHTKTLPAIFLKTR